jgi:hypothetical protein
MSVNEFVGWSAALYSSVWFAGDVVMSAGVLYVLDLGVARVSWCWCVRIALRLCSPSTYQCVLLLPFV